MPPEAHVVCAGEGVAGAVDLGSSSIVLDGERSPMEPPRWMGFPIGSKICTVAC